MKVNMSKLQVKFLSFVEQILLNSFSCSENFLFVSFGPVQIYEKEKELARKSIFDGIRHVMARVSKLVLRMKEQKE